MCSLSRLADHNIFQPLNKRISFRELHCNQMKRMAFMAAGFMHKNLKGIENAEQRTEDGISSK